MTARLDAFPAALKRRISDRMTDRLGAPNWPALKGCLCILFTARSGSTPLCREIERRYGFHRVNGSLNLAQITHTMTARGLGSLSEAIGNIVQRESERGWFAFKTGPQGLIAAETAGFIEAQLKRTRFIFLLRRDLVAQAVSLVKAEQTYIWHSTQIAERIAEPAVYSGDDITKAIRNILGALKSLRRYVDAAGRPCVRLFYEDFAAGDATVIEAVCDQLGLPRRRAPRSRDVRTTVKIGDEENLAWVERYNAEMEGEIATAVAEYTTSCAAAQADPAAVVASAGRTTRTAKSHARQVGKRPAS